jgi:hypothetical protein
MYKGIYASARDLAVDVWDAALERIRETGVNTITLAASQPAGPTPYPETAGGGASSPAAGMVHFRARPERYGHIKPQVHPMAGECDAFAELQRAAPDLGRAAWVSSCLDAPLDAHADYLSHNAFGAPYPHRLCPAHPAVRDYVVNLCSDLAHGYDVAAVVLETPGWLPCDRGYHPEFAVAPLDRWARTLLSLCFAGTMRHAAKAAGIDAERLQAHARQLLESYRDAPVVPGGMTAAWWFVDVVSDPEWTAFLDWRCRQVTDLVIEVKAALPAGTALAVIPSLPCGGMAARIEGSHIGMLAAAADALEIPLHEVSADEAYLSARDVRRRAGDDAALRFILGPRHPDPDDDVETREAVLKLKQIGMAGLAFYDYDHIRHAGPAPVKATLDALESA